MAQLAGLAGLAFSEDDVLKLLPSPPKTARIQTAITDLQAGSTGVPDSVYIYTYYEDYIYIYNMITVMMMMTMMVMIMMMIIMYFNMTI